VIGGSAGSFESLKAILGSLPADFPASILVVVHLSAEYPALLENQLSRWSLLPASHPADKEPIRRGHIYVARPDFHLTVEPGRMRLLRGPRENRHRPAIDPLFRTAARVYGPRVIGIVLSGRLDDGSTGLYAIKQRGGLAIVQDPSEAAFCEMPQRALAYANPQHVLRSHDIASKLVNMVRIDQKEIIMPNEKSRNHPDSAGAGEPDENLNVSYFDEGEGIPSVFACPECHGVLWELKDGDLVRFRCRVGHSYGRDSLAKELSQASEGALWAAMRALEEKGAMQRRVADALNSDKNLARRMRDQSSADDANARLIRDMIFARDARLEPEQSDLKKSA
jgi:two-component system chemotaxis response regulator CheB